MRNDLGRRLAQLERPQTGAALCFAAIGETDAHALARRWPDGAPLHVVILRWREPEGARHV